METGAKVRSGVQQVTSPPEQRTGVESAGQRAKAVASLPVPAHYKAQGRGLASMHRWLERGGGFSASRGATTQKTVDERPATYSNSRTGSAVGIAWAPKH